MLLPFHLIMGMLKLFTRSGRELSLSISTYFLLSRKMGVMGECDFLIIRPQGPFSKIMMYVRKDRKTVLYITLCLLTVFSYFSRLLH